MNDGSFNQYAPYIGSGEAGVFVLGWSRSKGPSPNNVFMVWSFYHEFINNINISTILTISLFATWRSSAETIMKTRQ